MSTVILSAVRTPIGAFMSSLSALSSPQLGSVAIKAAIERAGVKGEDIDEVINEEIYPRETTPDFFTEPPGEFEVEVWDLPEDMM